jgi:hypothetical protein
MGDYRHGHVHEDGAYLPGCVTCATHSLAATTERETVSAIVRFLEERSMDEDAGASMCEREEAVMRRHWSAALGQAATAIATGRWRAYKPKPGAGT